MPRYIKGFLVEVDEGELPKGGEFVEAYKTDKEIIVLGEPETDDESHNCDEMGCGTFGPHVLYRFPISN